MGLKKVFNGVVYASASLKQNPLLSDSEAGDDYLRQAQEYYDAGFDGMKFLEGHPSFRKTFGALSSKRYDKMFAFLEENGIPITIHNADPRSGWDINKVDAYALKHGRFYGDGSFPTFEECRDDVLRVVKKYPKLKMCLAHGAFLHSDIDKPYLEKFMGDYENTKVDVSATGATFNWSKQPEYFIPFIERYQDKIMYGSDTHNSAPYDYADWEWDIQYRPKMPRNVFMGGKNTFEHKNESYNGLDVDKNICRKVFYENAIKEYGNKPKDINLNWINKEIEKLEVTYKDNEYKFTDINIIKKYF